MNLVEHFEIRSSNLSRMAVSLCSLSPAFFRRRLSFFLIFSLVLPSPSFALKPTEPSEGSQAGSILDKLHQGQSASSSAGLEEGKGKKAKKRIVLKGEIPEKDVRRVLNVLRPLFRESLDAIRFNSQGECETRVKSRLGWSKEPRGKLDLAPSFIAALNLESLDPKSPTRVEFIIEHPYSFQKKEDQIDLAFFIRHLPLILKVIEEKYRGVGKEVLVQLENGVLIFGYIYSPLKDSQSLRIIARPRNWWGSRSEDYYTIVKQDNLFKSSAGLEERSLKLLNDRGALFGVYGRSGMDLVYKVMKAFSPGQERRHGIFEPSDWEGMYPEEKLYWSDMLDSAKEGLEVAQERLGGMAIPAVAFEDVILRIDGVPRRVGYVVIQKRVPEEQNLENIVLRLYRQGGSVEARTELDQIYVALGAFQKALHDRGVVHLDTRLANYIRDENGQIRIIDYRFLTTRPKPFEGAVLREQALGFNASLDGIAQRTGAYWEMNFIGQAREKVFGTEEDRRKLVQTLAQRRNSATEVIGPLSLDLIRPLFETETQRIAFEREAKKAFIQSPAAGLEEKKGSAEAERVRRLAVQDQLWGAFRELGQTGFTYQVVDQNLLEQFPQLAALEELSSGKILVDRSKNPRQTQQLIVLLRSRDARWVYGYYRDSERASRLVLVAGENGIKVKLPEPVQFQLLLVQLLANLSGLSEPGLLEARLEQLGLTR